MHFDCYIGKVDVVSSRYSALLGKNEVIPEVRAALLLFKLSPPSKLQATQSHALLPADTALQWLRAVQGQLLHGLTICP